MSIYSLVALAKCKEPHTPTNKMRTTLKLKCLRLINRNQMEVGKVLSVVSFCVCTMLCVCVRAHQSHDSGCACGYSFDKVKMRLDARAGERWREVKKRER